MTIAQFEMASMLGAAVAQFGFSMTSHLCAPHVAHVLHEGVPTTKVEAKPLGEDPAAYRRYLQLARSFPMPYEISTPHGRAIIKRQGTGFNMVIGDYRGVTGATLETVMTDSKKDVGVSLLYRLDDPLFMAEQVGIIPTEVADAPSARTVALFGVAAGVDLMRQVAENRAEGGDQVWGSIYKMIERDGALTPGAALFLYALSGRSFRGMDVGHISLFENAEFNPEEVLTLGLSGDADSSPRVKVGYLPTGVSLDIFSGVDAGVTFEEPVIYLGQSGMLAGGVKFADPIVSLIEAGVPGVSAVEEQATVEVAPPVAESLSVPPRVHSSGLSGAPVDFHRDMRRLGDLVQRALETRKFGREDLERMREAEEIIAGLVVEFTLPPPKPAAAPGKDYDPADLDRTVDEFEYRTVDEFELSVRTANCLQNANIRYVGELVQKTEVELLKSKNFGRKSLKEIKEVILKPLGLSFGMEVEFTPPHPKPAPAPVTNYNPTDLDRTVDEFKLSVRTANCLQNANIRYVGELVQKTEEELLESKNFGPKSLKEIKEVILEPLGLSFGMEVEFTPPPPKPAAVPVTNYNPADLDKSVDEWEVSVRTENYFLDANIRWIGELVQKTKAELMETKNFGRKSLKEIKELLATMGLSLGMKLVGWMHPELREKLNMSVDELNISMATKRILQENDILYVGDLVYKTEAELLHLDGIAKGRLVEIKRAMFRIGLGLKMVLREPFVRPAQGSGGGDFIRGKS